MGGELPYANLEKHLCQIIGSSLLCKVFFFHSRRRGRSQRVRRRKRGSWIILLRHPSLISNNSYASNGTLTATRLELEAAHRNIVWRKFGRHLSHLRMRYLRVLFRQALNTANNSLEEANASLTLRVWTMLSLYYLIRTLVKVVQLVRLFTFYYLVWGFFERRIVLTIYGLVFNRARSYGR